MSGPFKMKGWSPFTQKTHPDHPVTPPKNIKESTIRTIQSSKELLRGDYYSKHRKGERYSGESYPDPSDPRLFPKLYTYFKNLFNGD